MSVSLAAYKGAAVTYRLGKGLLFGTKKPRAFKEKIVRKHFGHLVSVKKARTVVNEKIREILDSETPEGQQDKQVAELLDAYAEVCYAHETGGELSWIDVKVVEPTRRVLRGVLAGTLIIGASGLYCNRNDILDVAQEVPVDTMEDTFQESIDETKRSISSWEARTGIIKDRLLINSVRFASLLSSDHGKELRAVFGDAVGILIGEKLLVDPLKKMLESWDNPNNPEKKKEDDDLEISLEDFFDAAKSPFAALIQAIEKNETLNPVFQEIKKDLIRLSDIMGEIQKLVEKNMDLSTHAQRLQWNLRSNLVERLDKAYNSPSRIFVDNSKKDREERADAEEDTDDDTTEKSEEERTK